MTRILGIDPGTDESGVVIYDTKTHSVHQPQVIENQELRGKLERGELYADAFAIEVIASYGMAVGKEVFETCIWIGRFIEQWPEPNDVLWIYRKDVKLYLCGQPKAKDSNIRQALLDLWPRTGGGSIKQVGTSKKPGPLFGMNTHTWPALGVALVAWERIKNPPTKRRKIKL